MKIEETVAFSIKAGYSDLRPSEKKAADFILSHFGEIRDISLEQLAACSGVSQPTIIRMVKALGYESFRAFRYNIVEETAQRGESEIFSPAGGYPVSREDKVSDVPAKMAAASCTMLEQCMKSLSIKTYQNVIDLLKKAGTIDIYGIENSSAACSDLVTKLTYLGLNCRYHADPYMQKISAGSLGKGDAAIGISYSGSSKDTVDALETAKKQGAAAVAITNFEDSPISRYADYLICTAQEQMFYGNAIFSRATQTLIVDMIYMGLLASDYDTFCRKLDENSRIVENKSYSKQD